MAIPVSLIRDLSEPPEPGPVPGAPRPPRRPEPALAGALSVPPTRHPTPEELTAAVRALVPVGPGAARRGRRVRLRRVGRSRGGRPLWALSVAGADGAESGGVLVVAGAHANEPVGGGTALALARLLLAPDRPEGPDPLGRTPWQVLLCADPDGAALHRTPAPSSLLDYHRGFYRPAGPEQPEWAPSLLTADRLPPETLALMGLIDRHRPRLQVSLHGTDLGGSWVQLTRELPGLTGPFAESAARWGLPVETGASDAAGWLSPGPGVFVLPSAGLASADTFHPEDIRLSTWHHAHRHGGTTAIVEVPMWAGGPVDDPRPHPDPRGELARLAARLVAESGRIDGAVRALVAASGPGAPGAGPEPAALLRAAAWTLEMIPGIAARWADPRAPIAPTEASRGGLASLDAFGRRLVLRTAAMAARAAHASGHPTAAALDARVEGWCAEFTERFAARAVPVAVQVEHQLGTVLAAQAALPARA
ncbi:M14 family zinc carboxypeptidase [Streptomyces sp. BI20]|uniref:M14 family zinc carboxypeptidase n=1 Tax=Streptomyces sp. BI20 TaxID=3403460 RepID=UPI003C76DEFA